MAERSATRWLVPVGVALLAGVCLSILSVPVAATLAQLVPAPGTPTNTTLRLYEARDGTVYAVQEWYRIDGAQEFHRPTLMRQRIVRIVPPDQDPTGPRPVLDPPSLGVLDDPRPAFLRRAPAPGFASIEGVSAGWPLHAAHSLTHVEGHPGTARREHGLLRLTISGKDIVLPMFPIWTGLLGNTLLYGGALLLAWWSLRGLRMNTRRARGGCAGCGYPLGLRMQRCPECGREGRRIVRV